MNQPRQRGASASKLLLGNSLVENGARFGLVRSKYPIALAGSKVAGTVSMNGIDLDANLALQDSEFAALDLNNARISGQVNLLRSKVTGDLMMNGLHARSLFMLGGQFAQVDLAAANVSDLNLYGAKVTGNLGINSGRVGERLLMDKGRFADVDLTALRVGQHLSMRSAHFAKVDLNSAHVGGSLLLMQSEVGGNLICFGLEVGLHLVMNAATFGGSIGCQSAKIRSNVYLNHSEFKKGIDLTGAEIGGELVLEGVEGMALKLQNAKIGILPNLAEAWPSKLELNGLTYRSVVAADNFEEWFRKIDHYAPQPYEQLASVVQSQGNSTLATAIRYAGRERERSEATFGEWVWLTALKLVIGYGYYPLRAVLWVIGLVLAGAVVLRVSGEGPRNGMPFGLTYSFDMLLPIIKLRDSHHQIDLKNWARYYFYGHKIMGWVLASFLLAGLSGLTK